MQPMGNEALKQAIYRRRVSPTSSLMFHAARSIQYGCDQFRADLREYHITQSMLKERNFLDNAVAESFLKSMKTEKLNKLGMIMKCHLNSLFFKYIEGCVIPVEFILP